MLRKILLWTGFVLGIAIVSFPSLMLVERIRSFGKSKSQKQEEAKKEAVQTEKLLNEDVKKVNYPEITDKGVVFKYRSITAQKVFVAGTFNNWDGRKGVMTRNIEGIWDITIPIRPGKYTYKFKVDGAWILDSNNPVSADDGKGGRASVLIIK